MVWLWPEAKKPRLFGFGTKARAKPKVWPGPKPTLALALALAWPAIFVGQSQSKPGQSHGFQAKPKPNHHYGGVPMMGPVSTSRQDLRHIPPEWTATCTLSSLERDLIQSGRCVGVKSRAQSPTRRHDAVSALGREAHRLAPLRSRMIFPPRAHTSPRRAAGASRGTGLTPMSEMGGLGMRRRSVNGAEDEDDRVGGQLAGTSMGGGVVTPFMAGVSAAGTYPHQRHYEEQPYARSITRTSRRTSSSTTWLEPAAVERRTAVAVIVLPTWADTDTVKRGVVRHVQKPQNEE
ncbi:hypothetical protein C8J57DRAFT_1632379 [Mycena rebaudengoi]|nr:hypothetical protein C8J57DRAFT_1632379 [Mycena rebaudengoi]